jgi:hypothetical protein
MKSIRVNTFETNSSSAHVLTIASKGSGTGKKGKLNWKGDEYGWEFESYCDSQSKFSYYLVALRDWLSLMQKKEYGKRHNLEEGYCGCYSFSFGSLTEIAKAKEKNDEYWIKHYKEIDEENINYIRNLAYDKVKGLFDYLKEKGCTFDYFHYMDEEHKFVGNKRDTFWKAESESCFLDSLEHLKDAPENEWKAHPDISDWIDFGGYIDHQSGPVENSECRTLASQEYEDVFDWIFGDSSFETGNDNY